MDFLSQLWLPILASAAAVWIWGALAWMLLPHHHNDHKGLPDEDGFMDAVRRFNIPPGAYGFPFAKDRKCKDRAFIEKWEKGPAGMFTVFTPNINMGANMIKTFVVCVIISAGLAYLGWAALTPGASLAKVMQVVGTAAVMAYSCASWTEAIWFQTSRAAVISRLIDGVAQGLITGAVFAWLWPRV